MDSGRTHALLTAEKRMANLVTTIPASLKTALDAEVARTKGTPSSIVTAALSQYIGVPVHTLFQVSISGALVAGVNGEMVVLDGRVYQVQGTGAPIMKKPFDTQGPVIVGVHVDYRDNHELFEMLREDSIH